jgi:hypothetical protein
MELTQPKSRFVSFAFYRILGNIGVPILGIILLLIVALKFNRAPAGLDRLDVGAMAIFVLLIGLAYFNQRRQLNRLAGKIDDRVLSGLCNTANSMATGGYLICIFALSLGHHH